MGKCGRVPQPAVPVPIYGPITPAGKTLGKRKGWWYLGLQMHMQPLGSLDVPCFLAVWSGWVSSARRTMSLSSQHVTQTRPCYSILSRTRWANVWFQQQDCRRQNIGVSTSIPGLGPANRVRFAQDASLLLTTNRCRAWHHIGGTTSCHRA